MTDSVQAYAQLAALRVGRRCFELRYGQALPIFAMRGLSYDVWTGGPVGGLLLVVSGNGTQRTFDLQDGGQISEQGIVLTELQLHDELAKFSTQAEREAEQTARSGDWAGKGWGVLTLGAIIIALAYIYCLLGG